MSSGPLLALQLDGPGPVGRRLEAALREAIRSGRVGPGGRLPSTRSLATDLGVSRGVVVGAYDQLAAEGYLLVRRGAAPVVAPLPAVPPASPVEPDVVVAAARWNLRPDLPDLSLFPRADWLRATRAVLARAPDTDLAYGEPFGAAELRHRLAPFLARTRGVLAEPGRVGIHLGSTNGLAVIGRALVACGARRVWIEEPSHRWRRRALLAAGLEPAPLESADVAVVSPTHPFPCGEPMPAAERRRLLAWAEASDAVVVEHDYDAHLRYDRAPTGALQALAPSRVVYVGTASALLAPTLRLGWSVLPEWLVEPVADQASLDVLSPPRLTQLAFGELVDRGYLDRQLRRVRAAYRRRHGLLRTRFPQATGAPAGLFLCIPVPDEAAALERARCAGFALDGVQANAPGDHEPGLVVGFAALPEPMLDRASTALATMLR